LFNLGEAQRFKILKMLNQVSWHLVNSVWVPRNFFMENARPDKGIDLKFRLKDWCSVNKEVEVQILPYCEKIVLNVF
jgi:hypothetical protein